MTGIYLLFAIALWLFIAFWLAKIITTKLSMSWWSVPVRVILFLALLPLPLIDEIVGKRQFEQLCNENSMIQVDQATAVGKMVYFDPRPPVDARGTWVRIVLQQHLFVDATTDKPVINYNTLMAEGGLFIRMLGISEGRAPLIFNGSCSPKENIKNLVKSLNITALDRPNLNTKGE